MTIRERTSQVPARSQPAVGRPMPEVAGVAHRYVETERLRVHIAEAGSGQPLLLLHGWPQHWYAWRELIPLLAASRRLICPDLRGFGWSGAPAGGYRTADLAADTVALLDALELDRVDVIGYGEGGRVGFELCLSHAARVGRMVTVGAMHPYPSLRLFARHAWRFWWTPLVETSLLGRRVIRHLPTVTRAVLRASAANEAVLSDAVIEEFTASVREPARARASERLMHEFAYHEMIPALLGSNRSRRLRTPVLMLNGERDFFIPARALGDPRPYADDLRIQVIPAAGHLLAEECPQAVADAVRAFLQ
ncbi:MAG: alpha/beta fold hydrolase [Trebonia sp.]